MQGVSEEKHFSDKCHMLHNFNRNVTFLHHMLRTV